MENNILVDFWKNDLSIAKIAEKYGVSEEYVREIINKYGRF